MIKRLLRQKKKNEVLSNLILLFLSILFLFVLGELIIRMIGEAYDIDFRLYLDELTNSERLPSDLFYFNSDPDRLNPNAQVLATTSDFSVIYKINSKGLRDKEYSYAKPPDVTRVLAFGDSITFGEGIRYGDRFTDIPEKDDIEIINFGIPGYGLDQELLLFTREGVKYESDYVMIFLSRVNIERVFFEVFRNGSLNVKKDIQDLPLSSLGTYYLKRNDSFFADEESFFKESYLLSYLNYNARLILLKDKLKEFDENYWGNINGQPGVSDSPGRYESYLKNRTIQIVQEFKRISEENGMQLIIVKIDPRGEFDYVGDIDEDIYYYDLTDKLYDLSKEHSLSYKYDPHYNTKTHKFIGEELKKILDEVIN